MSNLSDVNFLLFLYQLTKLFFFPDIAALEESETGQLLVF